MEWRLLGVVWSIAVGPGSSGALTADTGLVDVRWKVTSSAGRVDVVIDGFISVRGRGNGEREREGEGEREREGERGGGGGEGQEVCY